VALTQKGGLRATYYETTDFQAPFNDLPLYSHEASHFTQVDAAIDFAPYERAFTLKSARAYPSQYFSIKWEGHISAVYNETYRLYIEAFKTARF
jgi:hypothetical protein